MPGGHVEPGETVAAAVEREVLEETGLEVRCGPLLGWAERMGPGYHFVILDFTVVVPDGCGEPVPGSDAAAAAWVPLGEVGATVVGRRPGGLPPYPRGPRLTLVAPRASTRECARVVRRRAPPTGWAGGARAAGEWAGRGAGPARGPVPRPGAPTARSSSPAGSGSPAGLTVLRTGESTTASSRAFHSSSASCRGHGGARRLGEADGQVGGDPGGGLGGPGRDPKGVGDPAVFEGGDDAGQPAVTQCRHPRSAARPAVSSPSRDLRRRG